MTTNDKHARPAAADADDRALNERQAAILEAVVTEYIGSAEPVGSSHVANAPGVQVSSATVRSEMVALERDGYLVQPHTSAGRIPTDKGYRFFVDHLTQPGSSARRSTSRCATSSTRSTGRWKRCSTGPPACSRADLVCRRGGRPSHDSATIRSVQVVGLAPGLALLVVVLSDGAVEKRTIELDATVTDEVLGQSGALLNTHLVGRTTSASWLVPPSGNADVDRVVASAGTAFGLIERSMESDQVFVGGPSRLAQSFDAVETVRSVLGILEQQLVVVTLLRDVLNRGLSVAIGTEHGYEPLASCAVVVAPVSIDGYELGAVGLFGPTRMDYPRPWPPPTWWASGSENVWGDRAGWGACRRESPWRELKD